MEYKQKMTDKNDVVVPFLWQRDGSSGGGGYYQTGGGTGA